MTLGSATLQQGNDRGEVTPRGRVRRIAPILIVKRRVGAGLQQYTTNLRVPFASRHNKRGVARSILDIDRRPAVKERAHDHHVTKRSRRDQRSVARSVLRIRQ